MMEALVGGVVCQLVVNRLLQWNHYMECINASVEMKTTQSTLLLTLEECLSISMETFFPFYPLCKFQPQKARIYKGGRVFRMTVGHVIQLTVN